MSGEVINARYEVVETIALPEGEPLHEARVRDAEDGRIASMWVLSLEHLRSPATDRTAFLAGVEQAAQVSHPNLLRILDRGEILDSGDPYVVAEYLRGITLRERIRRIAPFSLSVTVDIAAGYLEALAALHDAGICHGDLRPQHIILTAEGLIKVAGVGYARAARMASGAFEPSLPYYPQIDHADSSALSPTDDLYAAGVILYEMLTGSTPLAAAQAGSGTSIRSLNPGVPPSLEGIVEKALANEEWKRYKTATDLLSDINAVRDALKSGRSLTWSPRTEAVPRPAAKPARGSQRPTPPSVADTIRTPVAAAAAASTVLPPSDPPTSEDEELNDRYEPVEKDPPSILGIVFRVLFVITVIAVIGAVWYIGKIFAVPDDIVIPNLIGQTYQNAQQTAQQQHFNLIIAGSDYSTKWPENQIYQQDPPGGLMVKAGHDVSVYYSLGPRTLTVPDLVGMTVTRATKALQDADLPVGTETDQYDDTTAQGVIMSQTPVANTSVPRETAVDYTVSKGKQPPDTPQNVQADTTSPTSVSISWDPAARADSYTVSRITDSGSTIVSQGIKDTKFTDSTVTPNTSYSYEVQSVNSAGTSDQSETVPVITPEQDQTPPVMGNNVQVTPPAGTDDTTTDTGTDNTGAGATDNSDQPAKMRQFLIKFRVPWHPDQSRRVQFEVQDATGSTLMYDETHAPGDLIQEPITAFGNKITLRIFVDGALVKQETR